MIQDIDVSLVYPASSARKIDEKNVTEIAASIKEIGLLSPITVRAKTRYRGTTPFDSFTIVVGHHRYNAVRSLKLPTIACIIVEMDDLHAELAAIDENLIRAALSASQEAEAITRRKEIYEAIHPETKADANASAARKSSDNLSFVASTAAASGKTRKTIERAAARGKALGEDLKAIAGTSLDKGVELDALAKLPADERADLVKRASDGEKVSAREPVAIDPPAVVEPYKSPAYGWQVAIDGFIRNHADHVHDAIEYLKSKVAPEQYQAPPKLSGRRQTMVSIGKDLLDVRTRDELRFLAAWLLERTGNGEDADAEIADDEQVAA